MGESREERGLRDLGDGLILRRATAADAERIVAFNGDIHRDPGVEVPNEGVIALARDLALRAHPTSDVSDFTLVEDTHTGAIVSSLNLVSQTWSYGGIKFGVGRPEMVGTHPDYRRRGLVRAQFEVIHEWSAQRGHKLQAITGVPWFYRQFGYEMAVELGGGRVGYGPQVPKLDEGEEEPYGVRPATEGDLPFIAEVYEQAKERYLLSCVRDEALWRYELSGRSEKNEDRQELRIVESATGEPVGFLAHPATLQRTGMMQASVYELKPGISWLAVTPSVVRYLWATGEEYAERDERQELTAFAFWLGTEHPVYQVIHSRLPRTRKPYTWYLRVPDLPDFLRHIAPVLEQRLAASVLVGHSGELKLSFYRQGLRLLFEQGRLTGVEPWQPSHANDGDGVFPDLTFLQLLFGYRTLEELDYAFTDCWAANDAARALLKALFPRQASQVWPVV
ncbi:MAG: GNAT family N-acetyltransferase [Chloroflexi bacterium]|nr:GNAT family N-acetyltransferase [Chloroflexota bacterium]